MPRHPKLKIKLYTQTSLNLTNKTCLYILKLEITLYIHATYCKTTFKKTAIPAVFVLRDRLNI